MLIRSLTRQETLYAVNSEKLLLPASNMKVVTLAAAAERLGWDFSYETRLIAVGPIEAGRLDGDLVVVGTGDPSIDDWDGAATRLFQTWAEQVKASGIRSIAGRVVGDDNHFDDGMPGSGWAWDDLDKSFATVVGALQFNENTARLVVTPGIEGEAPSVEVIPEGSGLEIRNRLTTRAGDGSESITTRRRIGSRELELIGWVPPGAGSIARNASVFNPTLYFVTALRNALVANGIEVRGVAADIDDLSDAPDSGKGLIVASYRSPPLSALARTMMKNSQNLYAETLVHTLGAVDHPVAGNTTEIGLTGVRSLMRRWDVPESAVIMADGSGLSRYNLATPAALVAVLAHVFADERSRESFQAALPVAGRDGTLAQRLKGTAAEGNARAKTGAFSNARALSGYVATADDEPLAFSIIANNYGTTSDLVERITDAIVARLAGFRR